MKCKCGKWKVPKVLIVGTKPNPSGMDVEMFGIVVQCPECKTSHCIEFVANYHNAYDNAALTTKELIEAGEDDDTSGMDN